MFKKCSITAAAYFGVIALFILFASGTTCSKNSPMKGELKKEKRMKNQSTYPVYHASTLRDCAIPVKTGAQGKIEWSSPLRVESPDGLRALLIWEDYVVIDMFPEFSVFNNGGKQVWKRSKLFGSIVAAGDCSLYYESDECYLNAVNSRNELLLDSAPFPGVFSKEFELSLFWPRKKEFLAVAFWPGHDPEEEPVVSWTRAIFGEVMGEEGGEYRQMLGAFPLFIPELDRLILGVDDIICLDIENGEEESQFGYPLAELVDWSANAEGILCITGNHEESKVLLAISHTGEEKWRWVDREKDDRWVSAQPPIRSEGQRVYALTSRRVLAIEQGKLVWEYEVEDQILRHGSSLADGSILITAGKTLVHLDRDGKQLFSVSLENEILTPPVADAEGNIYVATASHLVKIK